MADWFWKRDNLYLKNGKCVYAEECDECTENCNPEKANSLKRNWMQKSKQTKS